LLPLSEDGLPLLEAMSDMVWISGLLHLTMNQLVMPQNTSPGDPAGVKEVAAKKFSDIAEIVSRRYERNLWSYEGRWSIIDTYFTWVFGLATEFGYPIEKFPPLRDLIQRCHARPAHIQALAVENEANERQNLPILSPK